MFDLFSEPDFINGIIITLNKSNIPSTDIFISVLQSSCVVEELKAVLESVESEIIFVRSKVFTKLNSQIIINCIMFLKRMTTMTN